MPPYPDFFFSDGFWGSNACPHDCKTDTSLREPSPSPDYIFSVAGRSCLVTAEQLPWLGSMDTFAKLTQKIFTPVFPGATSQIERNMILLAHLSWKMHWCEHKVITSGTSGGPSWRLGLHFLETWCETSLITNPICSPVQVAAFSNPGVELWRLKSCSHFLTCKF